MINRTRPRKIEKTQKRRADNYPSISTRVLCQIAKRARMISHQESDFRFLDFLRSFQSSTGKKFKLKNSKIKNLYSKAEVIDSPPKTKRGSVRRQASIKASKSLGQVTKRKKKKLVTEVITPMDQ